MGYGYSTQLSIGMYTEDRDGTEYTQTYEVTTLSYTCEREIDNCGNAISVIKGGTIHLLLNQMPDKALVEWSLNHRTYKNILVQVMEEENKPIVTEEVQGMKSICTGMKLVYDNESSLYFSTLITISSEDMRVGRSSAWITNNWTR